MMWITVWLFLTAYLSLGYGWHGQPIQPVAQRVLAISTVPVLEPPLTADNAIERYTAAMQRADEAGAKGNFISKRWSELEPEAGLYRLDDLQGDLTYRTKTYDQLEMIGIQVINTTVKETPPDLLAVPFDSPVMIARFQRLFDALLPTLNERVRYLSVGNEVDAYLGNHDEWAAYQHFFEAAVNYIHQTAPTLQVGVTFTFDGASRFPEARDALNRMSDVVILTYYPFHADFTVRPPDSPLADFAQMVTWAGEKPLILQEVGYPAADSLGSSEANQAAFVRYVFQAWDAHRSAIPFLNYFALGDFSEDLCAAFLTYYSLPDSQLFHDFLCSLGLLKADGSPRAAWDAFREAGRDLSD